MTQLVIGLAGAAVGSFFGPMGAQIGFALGSFVGAGVGAPDQVGPRLDDLSTAVGSYGQPIPQVWGGDRVACPVIWTTPLKEVESNAGGKGGPNVLTYSYYGTFAVAIGEGPIAGIRKIWMDAKLVYDISVGAPMTAQLASTALSEFFTLYLGTETQMPDPTMEAVEGLGNVEPYRGTAYIVFNELPLADYGNRIPQVRVETAQAALPAALDYFTPQGVGEWGVDDAGAPAVSGSAEYAVIAPSNVLTTYSSLTAAMAAAVANADNTGTQGGNPLATTYLGFYTGTNNLPSVFPGGATLEDDPEYVYLIFATRQPDVIGDFESVGIYVGCQVAVGAGLGPYDTRVVFTTGGWESIYKGLISMASFYGANFINNCGLDYPGESPTPQAYGARFNIIRVRRLPHCSAQRCYPGLPEDSPDGLAQMPGQPTYCISAAGDVSPNGSQAEQAGTFRQLAVDVWAGSGVARYRTQRALGPVLANSDPNYNSEAFWTAAYDAATQKPAGTYGSGWPVVSTTVCALTADVASAQEANADLADIVTDVCLQAGLSAEQIDVTALEGIEVKGYIRTRVMSARAALEPLRQSWWFDCAEVDGKLVFVRRGGAVAATIPADDLGAGIDDAQEVAVATQRGQATELPASIGVAYKCRGSDYQILTQQSRRRVGGSRQQQQVELPLVLPDAHAAAVADVLLYEAWTQRNQRRLSLPPVYKRLVPTDVIEVSDGEFSYRLRVVEKSEDRGVIDLTCVDDYVGHYDPNAAFGSAATGGATLVYAGPARLVALDLPLLQDTDDGPGFYLAASVYGSRFRTTRALRRFGAGAWEALADLDTEAVIGVSETVLPAWDGGIVVDEVNSLTVRLLRGSLASITRAELLNGGNVCWTGCGELLQFQRATPLGDNRWRLNGLLRGRLGSEHASGSHAAGEEFVLLSRSSLRRVADVAANRDRASTLAGVPLGASVDQAFQPAFSNTDEALRPRSPVQLAAAPDPSIGGHWLIRWTRRTRLDATWRDYVGTPLGEAAESYLVEVLRAGAVISSTPVTSPSASVAALSGDQVRVRQLSAALGPGRPATLLIP